MQTDDCKVTVRFKDQSGKTRQRTVSLTQEETTKLLEQVARVINKEKPRRLAPRFYDV